MKTSTYLANVSFFNVNNCTSWFKVVGKVIATTLWPKWLQRVGSFINEEQIVVNNWIRLITFKSVQGFKFGQSLLLKLSFLINSQPNIWVCHVYDSTKYFEIVINATGAIFVAAINGHDLAAIYDFHTSIEEIIVCKWYIKAQH